MKLKYFLYASATSCVIWVSLFLMVIHKPLSLDVMQGYFQKKMAYLKSIDSKKIVLLAGSNGRYSHRCQTIEVELGVPCANMSIAATVSLTYQFDKIKPYLNAGDVVYLPLEYFFYNETKAKVMSGADVPYVLMYDHEYLFEKMDVEQILNAIFYPDLKYLISSVVENILYAKGVRKEYGSNTLTAQGDESKHTLKRAKQFKNVIDSFKWKDFNLNSFDASSYSVMQIISFLRWASIAHVKVIGGLPTVFDDTPVSDALIENIQFLYTRYGHQFIVMHNRSQYPRQCFYDSVYHLNEECQVQHSKKLSKYLHKYVLVQ